jgi:putative ABC transport system permease protein
MLLSAIDRKLLREVAQLKGQIATIALVLAGGITCFIALLGTYLSLDRAREAYYDRCRFADVFAHVERAPEPIARRLEEIPGVARVDTRISEDVLVPVEGMSRPATARLLSLPGSGEPAINAVHLLRGRLPERGRRDEVAVLESFAEAHGLRPGDHLPAVINGKLRSLRIVAVVLSPEFVYAIRAGSMANDPQRYAVLWMAREELSSAFRLDGAFNDVTLRLSPGASEAEVLAAVDRVLAPYGGDGAVPRSQQLSNKIVGAELAQLRVNAGTVPLIFLGVAVFLTNLVLGRLIALQRPDIAALKALGYTNGEVQRHYLGLVAMVMVPGGLLGVLGGWLLGRTVLGWYTALFRFPDSDFQLPGTLVAASLGVSAGAALAGALLAVRSAVALPPAEAMRPPAPARYERGLLDRLGLGAFAGPAGLMVVRELQRRPLRTALSAVGIAGAVALVILSRFGVDSLAGYVDGTLRREQRHDLMVTFARPVDKRVVGELHRMPGVLTAEGIRAVPVRVRHEHRKRDSVLMGLPSEGTLRRLVGRGGHEVPVPGDGVLVTSTLGEILGLRVGDPVDLELREGDRRRVRPVVAGFIDESVGLFVYAKAGTVAALEGDLGAVSSAAIVVEPEARPAVEARLRRSPHVVDVADLRDDIQRMRDMNASILDIWTAVAVSLSGSVIFGVVYNNARIALAARSRELATLRILGLSRTEISWILTGSLAIEVLLAIPVGLFLGRTWAELFFRAIDPETFRWSVVVAPPTYLLGTAVAALAAAASALWVRRSLDRLDLIGVLKTRE